MEAVQQQIDLATAAGFTAAATVLDTQAKLAARMAIAYEHYRYVTPAQWNRFNAKLKQATLRFARNDHEAWEILHRTAKGNTFLYGSPNLKTVQTWKELTTRPVEEYPTLPPQDVLLAVSAAKQKGCFDSFEVAFIAERSSYQRLPDPIVFGRIDGCGDRFYIAQWDDDVKITDLLGDHEG